MDRCTATDALLSELASEAAASLDATQLSDRLREAYERACRAWPSRWLSFDAFGAAVGAALAADEDVIGALQSLHAGDFVLAQACARGEQEALDALGRTVVPEVERALASFAPDAQIRSDALSRLWQQTLAPRPRSAPEIATYRGQGRLFSWLRICGVRCVLALRREQRRDGALTSDVLLERRGLNPDPELELLKKRYRREFKQAFEHTLARLPDRDKNLLRFVVVDELSMEQIGSAYGIHRSNVSRWLAKTRDKLSTGTRAELEQRLAVDASELESILRLIESQLDASFAGPLAAATPLGEGEGEGESEGDGDGDGG